MLAQEISRLPSSVAGTLNTVIPEETTAAGFVSGEPDAETALPADLSWDPLLAAVAAYLVIGVGRVHQLFPVLEIFHPATMAALAALVAFALDRSGERQLRDVLFGPTKFVVALLVWMVLSVPGALVLGASVDVVFGDFIKTAIMFVVMAGAIRGTRDVERLALVYFASATLYAAVVIARFDVGSGEAWRLGRLYYYDANDFATFIVTALPLGIYFLHAGRGMLTRGLACVSLGVLALAFVRTGSRGGFIALLAVATFVLLRYTAIALRWRIAATALVALVVLGTASDQYWTQMGTILSDSDYNRTDESGRMQIWRRGIGYMFRNPVFGVGPGNFSAAEGMLSPFADRQQFGFGVRWNAAHNSYIQVGAELGMPGLCLFVAIIVGAFIALGRLTRADRAVDSDTGLNWRALTHALTGSLVGFVVGAYFLSLAYSEMFYTLLAMIVGLCKVARTSWSTYD